MGVLAFLTIIGAICPAGFAVLKNLGLGDGEAWAGGRVAALVGAAFPAWWWATMGGPGWKWVAVAIAVPAIIFGLASMLRKKLQWAEIGIVEAAFWGAFLIIIWMRISRPEIMNTEKPMDLGIMTSLLRTADFPPPDMWLAHESLPYYYWGALLWTVPLWASRIDVGIGYNLVVALVGAMVTVLALVLGRRLSGGGWSAGLIAAFFAVFAGTPDGFRQLFAGGRTISLWDSSRQIPHAITEFPLFTLWLGDLHPHLLSVPLALMALLLALVIGSRGCPRTVACCVVTAGFFGLTWAANPWAMPPTLAMVGVVILAGDGRWHWPWGQGAWRWAAVLAISVAGWLLTAPFQLAFQPPFDGIGLVHAWTKIHHLLLYAGCLMVVVVAATCRMLMHQATSRRSAPQSRALLLITAALAVVVAVVSGRITLVLLAVVLAGLLGIVVGPGEDRHRPAFALAAVGVVLFVAPELVFVRDSYGADLHRMNTIFKAYFQGWIVLALVVPVLLNRAWPETRKRGLVLFVLVALCLPHTAVALYPSTLSARWGLDGLRFMSSPERQLVDALASQPSGSVVVEATGGAYSRYGRLSAASGVPSYLGWANHELVWRGGAIAAETRRREKVIETIYTAGDAEVISELLKKESIDLIAIGELELRDFPAPGLTVLRKIGQPVWEEGDFALLRVGLDKDGMHD